MLTPLTESDGDLLLQLNGSEERILVQGQFSNPANRIELSRGRDLVVDPAPASGPINFLAYPVLEVAGQPKKTKVQFSFQRAHPRPPGARSS